MDVQYRSKVSAKLEIWCEGYSVSAAVILSILLCDDGKGTLAKHPTRPQFERKCSRGTRDFNLKF